MSRHEGHRKVVGRRGVLAATLVWAACACLAPARAEAATALSELRLSTDVPVFLGPFIVTHNAVVLIIGFPITVQSFPGVPPEADLDAYHLFPNGLALLSFDITVALPGAEPVTAEPGDVVAFFGTDYSMEFQATSAGIPAGVNVDAVSWSGNQLLLSFDGSVELNGVHVDDEDLVTFHNGGALTMFFDGSAAGVGPDLDLDAADYLECNGHLLLSFDGSGVVGGVSFDDEDLLEYGPAGTWEMAYDGSAQHPEWSAADLDAVQAEADPGPGPALVFGQPVLASANQTEFQWSNPVAWKAVRGAAATPAGVGAYQVSATFSGSGTILADPSVPPLGTLYWYLVKPATCLLTSWQSTLGAEPGRDAAIP